MGRHELASFLDPSGTTPVELCLTDDAFEGAQRLGALLICVVVAQ